MKYQEYHSVIKEQLERQFDQEGPNIERRLSIVRPPCPTAGLSTCSAVAIPRCLPWRSFTGLVGWSPSTHC